MSIKNPANYSPEILVTISLVVIAFIGLCVIIGWHLRVQGLVQIIPGAIPMQYNTALCFILLASSAGAIITKRVPHALAVLGGGLVGLFGQLVVFQHVTEKSLGIDTLFFYPWDQTLSADPGRMALTTAVCFALSGFTVGLLTLCPRALIGFVLAHTFPLSFGITSLLGYLFGITYVLPFRLGSQMAIHTATAFTIYGDAMLYYAWWFVPRRADDDLPRWMPGIAVVMIPVFFVSFGSSFLNDSLAARSIQVLLAFIGTTLLALALHKLLQARIIYKGLILIAVPMLFVLGFVWLVNEQKREGEKAQNLTLHSKEVIARAHSLTENLIDAQSSVRGISPTACCTPKTASRRSNLFSRAASMPVPGRAHAEGDSARFKTSESQWHRSSETHQGGRAHEKHSRRRSVFFARGQRPQQMLRAWRQQLHRQAGRI